ncbi:MAG: response regulator [bacterium]
MMFDKKDDGKRVLIADDSLFMRKNLKNILINIGYNVVGEAVNGLIAVEMYGNLKPDLVTLDITMPQMDGISALKAIKKIDNNAKVIMCSAMGQKYYLKDAFDNGAIDYIIKPFNVQIILDVFSKASSR